MSQTSDSGDDIGKSPATPSEEPPTRSKGRKSIFKKKPKKVYLYICEKNPRVYIEELMVWLFVEKI